MGSDIISWSNIDPDLQCHTITWGHNELIHCGLVMPYGDIKIWINVSSGNGFVSNGTKPLPEPVFSNHQLVLDSNFTENAQDIYPWHEVQND